MKSLILKDLSVQFGEVEALKSASIELREGQCLMLIGPNGAGKSTMLKVLLGLVKPQQGTIQVDGETTSVDNRLKSKLGYLPEAVAFSENLTGRQVLTFFARARKTNIARIDVVLARVGLSVAADRKVRGYSRGMRQRLGLGVSILSEPALLILDEPTGGLDQEGLSVLWSVLQEWKQKGRLVLLSSHDLALLERRVDRIVVMRSGEVVADGTPDELRRLVDLPHAVRFHISPSAKDVADAFLQEIDGSGLGQVQRTEDDILVEVASSSLLELMDIRGRHPDAVDALRVEEPTLDAIYEQLLEEE